MKNYYDKEQKEWILITNAVELDLIIMAFEKTLHELNRSRKRGIPCASKQEDTP